MNTLQLLKGGEKVYPQIRIHRGRYNRRDVERVLNLRRVRENTSPITYNELIKLLAKRPEYRMAGNPNEIIDLTGIRSRKEVIKDIEERMCESMESDTY